MDGNTKILVPPGKGVNIYHTLLVQYMINDHKVEYEDSLFLQLDVVFDAMPNQTVNFLL